MRRVCMPGSVQVRAARCWPFVAECISGNRLNSLVAYDSLRAQCHARKSHFARRLPRVLSEWFRYPNLSVSNASQDCSNAYPDLEGVHVP